MQVSKSIIQFQSDQGNPEPTYSVQSQPLGKRRRIRDENCNGEIDPRGGELPKTVRGTRVAASGSIFFMPPLRDQGV
jgi:hypothetical protein